jgi:thiaminase
LQAFTAQRAALLAVLQPLTPEAWSRTALVTGAGKPRERTVQIYAQWLANHEQSHIRQIERIVNSLRS